MKYLRLLKAFLDEMKRDNISAHAASAAFFIFVSFIPMLIVVCSILPFTPVKEADLMNMITDIMPTSLDAFAVSIIDEIYGKSVAVLSITIVITLWAASKGILAVIRGLNAVNEVTETRNYFYLRFKASLDTIVFLAMITASLVLMVFGNIILNKILEEVPKLSDAMIVISFLRFLCTWLLLILLFMLMYSLLPNKHQKFKTQITGAVFSATGWLIFSFGFSLYIDFFGGFTMYGSLTTIVVVMLWLYFCMYIVLLGAEINSFYDDNLVTHFINFRKNRKELQSSSKKE